MKRIALVLLFVLCGSAHAVDFTPIGGFSSSQIDTSAELAAIVGDETGSGALVFGTAPTFTTSINLGGNCLLYPDAANTLALRNDTNPQTLNVYGTYTDANNYSRLRIGGFSGNIAEFVMDSLGTGPIVDFRVGTEESAGRLILKSGGSDRWILHSDGVLRAQTDNTYDIGLSSSNRPRSGYFATSVVVGANTDPKVIVNRTAATDYARVMFQTGGTEMFALGPRGDNGGSGINNTLSLTGNAADSYPVVLNVIPGGANYTVEVGAAHKLKASGKFSHGTAGALTIATGAITVTKGYHAIDTEAAAATDDLDTINGGAEGDRVIVRAANAARTVVLKDGTGNLKLEGDCSLDNSEDTIELIHDGTNWLEVCRSNNGA